MLWLALALAALAAGAAGAGPKAARRPPTCAAGGGGASCAAGNPGVLDERRVFGLLRQLLAGAGTFSRRLLQLKALDRSNPAAGLGVFARRKLKGGEVLIEVPLSHALWRETADPGALGVELPPGALLAEAERLVLCLAVLRRRAERGEADASPFAPYAKTLLAGPAPNSTVFWGVDELAWLRGTDAGELSSHFLSRVAHVHSIVPLAAELEELKVAFAQFNVRHFRMWLGGSAFYPGRVEAVMVPGADLFRPKEGGIKPQFDTARRTIRLVAAAPARAGDELFADFGPRDLSDLLVGRGELGPSSASVFLPVPLDTDSNGPAKGRLLEHFRWPAEVRLVGDEVRELRALRLAAMPREEFSAWSVGALAAGAPLAVSRAFRTEVQAHAYLLSECSRRVASLEARRLPEPRSLGGAAGERLQVARAYAQALISAYSRCRTRARDRLRKLRAWAARQPAWAHTYVEEALLRAEDQQPPVKDPRQPRLLPIEPPPHVDPGNLDQRLDYATTVSLVNSRAQDFVPYFIEVLREPASSVEGFRDVTQRLQKARRLASAIVQLKGPACGAVDLSAFDWVNGLRGEEDVFATLKYLLPEMEDLVKEFAELEQTGDAPTWR